MGELIRLPFKAPLLRRNALVAKPWEFRKAHWESSHFVQMLREVADRWEDELGFPDLPESRNVGVLPPHFTLKGGVGYTIRGMCALRGEEDRMREAYYLVGLLDCLINQVNPILRTDILRDLYRKVFEMKDKLQLHWFGPLDQVLLPIDLALHDASIYRASLNRAATMKELYQRIREGTDAMFAILGRHYVFYCPRLGPMYHE